MPKKSIPPHQEEGATQRLEFGTWVLYFDEPWFISGILDDGAYELKRPGTPDHFRVNGIQLRPLLGDRYHPERLMPLDSYPPVKQAVALSRKQALDDLLRGSWDVETFRQCAKALGKSIFTLRRYLNTYLLYGLRTEALVPCAFRYGVQNRQLRKEVETIIEEAKPLYLNPERYSDNVLCSHIRRPSRAPWPGVSWRMPGTPRNCWRRRWPAGGSGECP